MNHNRLNTLITLLLFTGFLLIAVGQTWVIRESTKSLTACTNEHLFDDISVTRMQEVADDLLKIQSHIQIANVLRLLGICLFCPAYMVLVHSTKTNQNAPLSIKALACLLAALFCLLGIRLFAARMPLGLLTLFIALLLALPNAIATKSRRTLLSYTWLTHILLCLWFALTVFDSIWYGLYVCPLLLMLAVLSTAASAATLSSWIFYLRSTPDSKFAKWCYRYRRGVIIFSALIYSLYAILSTVRTVSARAEQAGLTKRLEQMQQLLEPVLPTGANTNERYNTVPREGYQ